MRQKITQTSEVESDLPDLTPQQRKFVEGILSGLSSSDSYRAAYDCSNSKDATVWCEASKLRNHPKISIWIIEATKAGLAHAGRSREQHIRRLDRLQELSIISGNLGAAFQCEQAAGKVAGHYTEHLEINTGDPLESLKQIEQLSPDLARKLAEESGIAWPSETKH
jgi:hypothetical protein